MGKKIKVNAAGCSLVDNLYTNVDFSSAYYTQLLSKKPGDGGLTTGGLVFAESLVKFAAETTGENRNYPEILFRLTGKDKPDSSNIGGPGIVPLIHAHQVRRSPDIQYRFAGVLGRDSNAGQFKRLIKKTGFPLDDFSISDFPTPSTDVLSNPDFDGGKGERTFINTIGAAGNYTEESLPNDFFDADILLFGGTALVPSLHDNLDKLCEKGKNSGAFIIVNTVYDFRNEAVLKGKPWPLVKNYSNIDLLITDREEALKISGEKSAENALEWFLGKGCGSVIITRGAENVLLKVKSGKFLPLEISSMPTSRYADKVVSELTAEHDTTGCGDNFVGGVLDSVAHQLTENRKINLKEAVISGVAAGSITLTCLGGVYYEKTPGEKYYAMKPYFNAYRRELEGL